MASECGALSVFRVMQARHDSDTEAHMRAAQGLLDVARAALGQAIEQTPSGLRRCLLSDAQVEMARAMDNLDKAEVTQCR